MSLKSRIISSGATSIPSTGYSGFKIAVGVLSLFNNGFIYSIKLPDVSIIVVEPVAAAPVEGPLASLYVNILLPEGTNSFMVGNEP